MLQRLNDYIYARVAESGLQDGSEVYQYFLFTAAAIFGALAYAGLLLIFLGLGVWPMAALDAAALLLMVPFYRAVHYRRRYMWAGILFSLLVTCTTTVHILLLGTNTYLTAYFVLVAAIQLVAPYARLAVRGVILALVGGCVVTTTALSFGVSPPYRLGSISIVLALYNVFIAFTGVCVLLFLVSVISRVAADLTARQLEQMADQANSDALTGLRNRRYAYRYFERLRVVGGGLTTCVAMVDVDNFKLLNDHHGHAAGDAVLEVVADVLRGSLRGTDLVVRWGGEEFLLVLPGSGIQEARAKLEEVRGQLAATQVEAGGQCLAVTVTIGVAPLDITDIDGSINACDQKLYQGKAQGKNRVVI